MSKQMMIVVGIIVVLLIAGGVIMLTKNDTAPTIPSTPDTVVSQPTSTSDMIASMMPEASGSVMPAGPVKTFTVTGSNFKFTPATLSVNKGDTVKITFNNSGGSHDFVIDEFNVQAPVIQSGASETVQFVASKTGSFDYYCSVDGHRSMGMQGVLTVK